MCSYEQKITITLTQEEAEKLNAALYWSCCAAEDAHPNSALGFARVLTDELNRVACGDKSQTHVHYEMVAQRV